MREKVDVLQGITGIVWIIIGFLVPIHRPVVSFFEPVCYGTTCYPGEIAMIDWQSIIIYGIILPLFGIIITLMREEHGIDLFGIISVIAGPLLLLICQFYYLIPFSEGLWVFLIISITGIGLILEAFDVIKPIKI